MRYLSVLGAAFIAMGLASAVVYGGAAPEQDTAKIEESDADKRIPLLIRGIELTAEQKTKMQEIAKSNEVVIQEIVKQLRAVRGAFASKILSSEKLEENQLDSILEQILFLQNQLERQNLRLTLAIRNLLTPEQLAQGAAYRERIKAQSQR